MAERNCKKCFHYNACKEVSSHSGYADINYTESQCKNFIPTADIVKVKHGYWKWEKKIEPQAQNRLYCSVCDNECLGKNNYYVKSEYCPHCFARMDGTPKERGADKTKITCLNCKHLMFSDMYGECNKQLKIVNPSDTCKYAEPKERGGKK